MHLGEYAFAADCYARMGDIGSQVDILIKASKWDEVSYLLHLLFQQNKFNNTFVNDHEPKICLLVTYYA